MSLFLKILFIFLLTPAIAQAQEVFVPEALRDWQQWVLKDKEYVGCPFFFDRTANQENDFICAWPGTLALTVGAEQARFTQEWSVYAAEQWLALPGDSEYWPHQVTANGRPVEIVAHRDVPSVKLGPGEYRISGSFEWDERPGVLRLPASIGLIVLTVDGESIERPDRTRGGIFLGDREQPSQVRDAVQANVYRLVADGVPTRLTTRLRINVSGNVREEIFGSLLPGGFVPLTLNSPLPARLEADGNLRVQVRPGTWVIEVAARAPKVLDTLSLSAADRNLPATEIWSYRSRDELRVTAAAGPSPVDPEQVDVPPDWRQLPAFRMVPGASLTITERSRGMVSANNELTLRRQMWLDFDGEGYVVSDTIGGSMRVGWRLDMGLPYALLNAIEDGANLLITKGARDGQTGVEVRRRAVDVEALGRADARQPMPVTGWETRFASVSAVVNLPPGHKLLAAPGVDNAPSSWAGRWQLLDFFLVLVITIGSWRLFGHSAGVIALVAVTLSFHEANAPIWLWLNLLIAVALMRVAPAGRLLQSVRVYRAVSIALLVLTLVPFVGSQLRIAIYPQLEPQYGASIYAGRVTPQLADMAATPPEKTLSSADELHHDDKKPRERTLQALGRAQEPVLMEGEVLSPLHPGGHAYSRYAPNANVQAGPGKPGWSWNSYALEWSGPVESEQTMRLMVLPRWAVTLLRFAEVAALLMFAAVVAAEVLKRPFTLPGGLKLGSAAASSLGPVFLLAACIFSSPTAQADTPDPDLLRQLEQRLLEPPDCVPRCGEVVAAEVNVRGDSIQMSLSMHALEDIAVPLPGSEKGWRPAVIQVDGGAASQVLRGQDRRLWARLSAGRHTITLNGPLPDTDSVEIPFPTPPRFIEARGDGWSIAGIKDRRLLSGSLQLSRIQGQAAGDARARWESDRFPPFVQITRTVHLDLDWYVMTTVQRIAPVRGAITVEIPLIADESVLTDGITMTDGRVLISMGPDQNRVSWNSRLPRHSSLQLDAEGGSPWQEIWRVGVGRTWHAEFSGVPESEQFQGSADARLAEFYPRGNEILTIDTTRPEASAGSTLAFDSVKLSVDLGSRSRTTNLSLSYRSTRGAQHIVQLPQNAEVTEVHIDGKLEPLHAEAGEMTIPILPGQHDVDIRWRSGEDVTMRSRTPEVDIGGPSGNIELSVSLPANRWLLATSGPRLGPAVLYWPELVVLLVFAAILGRIRLTPLKTWQWLLLGLGFSTFNWPVLGLVVAWLLACGARERWQGEAPWWQFNSVQIVVTVLTVVALGAILASLPGGLLGTPDMHLTGNNSYGNTLRWFADRSESVLPVAAAWTVPMWVYKALILGWALWLSFALLRWLPWVWRSFSSQGYWRTRIFEKSQDPSRSTPG